MDSTLNPFVIFSLQPWDTPIGSNCKNIAKELSHRTKILYVNIPLDWNTLLRKHPHNKTHITNRQDVRSGNKPALEEVEPNLFVYTPKSVIFSINMLPPGRFYDFMNLRNNKKIASEIKPVLHKLGIEEFYTFTDSDMFRSFYMKELLQPKLSIYYSRDNLISTDYFKKHGARLEPLLIAKSDLATANSTYLRDYCKQYNPSSYYIGQGCDLSIFDPNSTSPKPTDMQGIAGPIIGYIGFLTSIRLDIDLLITLAQKHPEWSIVLVGPEDQKFKDSALHSLSNVHFLGSKQPDELGKYLKYFDVAINPQVINDMTIGNYPRKVDEYLAMGKPVVATATKAMSVFSDHCYLGSTAEDYEQLIAQALNDDNAKLAQKRVEFAREHTWENSVKSLIEAISETTNNQ